MVKHFLSAVIACNLIFAPGISAQVRKYCPVAFTNECRKAEEQMKLERKVSRTSATTYYIPVVVHLVYNSTDNVISDDEVIAQIDQLNKSFAGKDPDIGLVPEEFRSAIANTNIHFFLSDIDPDGMSSNGITRTFSSIPEIGLRSELFVIRPAWDPQLFLNIWVADLGSGLLGLGSLPWTVNASFDGILLAPDCMKPRDGTANWKGKTLAHEAGHYLGLYHIWGDEGNACIVGDYVDDTPPQEGPTFSCPEYPKYTCGYSNMFMNYMDYTDDECLAMFSNGQSDKMRQCAERYRMGVLNNGQGHFTMLGSQKIKISGGNPTRGILPILSSENTPFTIIDYTGKTLSKGFLTSGIQELVDIRYFPDGIYMLITGSEVRKIVKRSL